jgi:hypothetical protein
LADPCDQDDEQVYAEFIGFIAFSIICINM